MLDVTYKFLDPDDAELLPAAIRSAYGDSYDLDWVYDVEEVRRRLDDGRYTSMAAISADGSMLCHGGMAKTNPADRVGHSGQQCSQMLIGISLENPKGRTEREAEVCAGVTVRDRKDIDAVQQFLLADDPVYSRYECQCEGIAIDVTLTIHAAGQTVVPHAATRLLRE